MRRRTLSVATTHQGPDVEADIVFSGRVIVEVALVGQSGVMPVDTVPDYVLPNGDNPITLNHATRRYPKPACAGIPHASIASAPVRNIEFEEDVVRVLSVVEYRQVNELIRT
jgi:hypothetical protein